MTPLRFGLIGCGFIGGYHVEAAQTDGRVVIAAYADLRERAAHEYLRRFGGEYATSDPTRLIADDSLDGVIIATHHDSHAELTTLAARAGRHVLIEKPMGRTVGECLQMADAVERAGVRLAVNYKFRLEPAVRHAWTSIAAPLVMHAQFAGPAIRESDAGAWVFDPVRGGGLVNATACHVLDLLGWFARSSAIWCAATGTEIETWHPGLPDALTGAIRFASGAVASLLVAGAGENPYTSRWFFQAYDGRTSSVLHDRFQRAVVAPQASDGGETAPRSMLASLVDSIVTGVAPVAGADAGIAATLLAESLTDSARLGRPVRIPAPGGSS